MPLRAARELMEKFEEKLDRVYHPKGKRFVLKPVAMVAINRKVPESEVEGEVRKILAGHEGLDYVLHSRGDLHLVFLHKLPKPTKP